MDIESSEDIDALLADSGSEYEPNSEEFSSGENEAYSAHRGIYCVVKI